MEFIRYKLETLPEPVFVPGPGVIGVIIYGVTFGLGFWWLYKLLVRKKDPSGKFTYVHINTKYSADRTVLWLYDHSDLLCKKLSRLFDTSTESNVALMGKFGSFGPGPSSLRNKDFYGLYVRCGLDKFNVGAKYYLLLKPHLTVIASNLQEHRYGKYAIIVCTVTQEKFFVSYPNNFSFQNNVIGYEFVIEIE